MSKIGIVVCDRQFTHPDPKDPSIALHEVDFYAWTPYKFHKTTPNHALSLRFRFKTKHFEIYRRFMQPVRFMDLTTGSLVITNKDLGMDQVIFESNSLEESLEFANGEYLKFHGKRKNDKVCLHKGRQISILCDGED